MEYFYCVLFGEKELWFYLYFRSSLRFRLSDVPLFGAETITRTRYWYNQRRCQNRKRIPNWCTTGSADWNERRAHVSVYWICCRSSPGRARMSQAMERRKVVINLLTWKLHLYRSVKITKLKISVNLPVLPEKIKFLAKKLTGSTVGPELKISSKTQSK